MYSPHSAALTSPQELSEPSLNDGDSSQEWPFVVYPEVNRPNIRIDANTTRYQPAVQHSNVLLDAAIVSLGSFSVIAGALIIYTEMVIGGFVKGLAPIALLLK